MYFNEALFKVQGEELLKADARNATYIAEYADPNNREYLARRGNSLLDYVASRRVDDGLDQLMQPALHNR